MFWSAEHQICFHSPVLFPVSQPVDRIQTLERKLKALEDERARRSTEDALITLRRHLNLPLNMFDRYEVVELLQSLVRLARNEAHEKADMYAATLDEVKATADLLDKESLQRLLVGLLGDPVRAKIAKEATSILKSSSGASVAPSRGFRYTRPKPYGNTRCFNCNRFGHMARKCFFNQPLLSSLIERPVGGSGAVRISLASEVGDHCFVEVFVLWEICFSIIFPWHVYFGVIQQCCLQAPSILL